MSSTLVQTSPTLLEDQVGPRHGFVELALRERTFLIALGAGFLAAGMFYENAAIAR